MTTSEAIAEAGSRFWSSLLPALAFSPSLGLPNYLCIDRTRPWYYRPDCPSHWFQLPSNSFESNWSLDDVSGPRAKSYEVVLFRILSNKPYDGRLWMIWSGAFLFNSDKSGRVTSLPLGNLTCSIISKRNVCLFLSCRILNRSCPKDRRRRMALHVHKSHRWWFRSCRCLL